ncbi:MAG TPA: NHL repeat-containing protein [Tepidisphaeraceae bacterium]|jgi:DNA-binding beta-propeller fold protein YncE
MMEEIGKFSRPVMLLAFALMTCAAAPIPADKQIPASVTRTIAGPKNDALFMPTDVAVDSKNRVYVADGVNDRIVRFSADGELDLAFARIGEQTLSHPVGVTVDASDVIYITDTGHHRIIVATPDGKLRETIDLPAASGTGEHSADPTKVAVKPDGSRLYVVDNENHRILIRAAAEGADKSWTILGKSGKALGQFQWPFMLCIGEEDYVYVTEAIGCRVQMISPTDRWAGQVSQWGITLGSLYRPKGIAADGKGRVFVSDSTLSVVQVFNPRGNLEGILTDDDGKPLRFAHPMGMTFDAAGHLYVVELKENRVAVVTLGR